MLVLIYSWPVNGIQANNKQTHFLKHRKRDRKRVFSHMHEIMISYLTNAVMALYFGNETLQQEMSEH